MALQKSTLLDYYRKGIEQHILEAKKKTKNNEKSTLINSQMKKLLSEKLNSIATKDFESILMVHYTYYIAMLEARNQVWEYDYMSFSRRIGELWEPFCKLPFEYSINKVDSYEPPKYDKVKRNLHKNISEYIDSLKICHVEKSRLLDFIDEVWAFSESGAINLTEDLHFSIGSDRYVVDYKSGFSSNEKGNVNRLLQVAKIYSTLGYKCLLFVRQPEEENNHYLQTLKNSNLWEVYCSSDTYDKIFEITGIDLRKWMDRNMDWTNDISSDFRDYLVKNNLIQYLTW
ncbi:hypothetical protein [Streptococcus constellatus]|uniref:hypothetical protein n=1 Tax=Streptococcus constellatus TaxID=76860 RepID=UPI002105C545|nr:hypothetical protein [Streptococcus constellatus]UTX65149.1 hypothetical protein DEH83_07790 [Streptococcus constellatus]